MSDLRQAPATPSVAGAGVTVTLGDGQAHEVRFSARAIIRLENTFGSHEEFLAALERQPVGTLASVLLVTSVAKSDDACIDLMEGVDWRALREQVRDAWRVANIEPDPNAVPTTAQ